MLSRESTSLTLVCFLIAAWGWMRWRDRIVAVVSAAAGSVLVSHLASRAQPNSEHLPQSLYMMAKVPWNFMNNVLGIVPWSNVNTEFCTVPNLDDANSSWWSPCDRDLRLFISGWMKISEAILSDFGLLPLLLCFVWWRSRKLADAKRASSFLPDLWKRELAACSGAWYLVHKTDRIRVAYFLCCSSIAIRSNFGQCCDGKP